MDKIACQTHACDLKRSAWCWYIVNGGKSERLQELYLVLEADGPAIVGVDLEADDAPRPLLLGPDRREVHGAGT